MWVWYMVGVGFLTRLIFEKLSVACHPTTNYEAWNCAKFQDAKGPVSYFVVVGWRFSVPVHYGHFISHIQIQQRQKSYRKKNRHASPVKEGNINKFQNEGIILMNLIVWATVNISILIYSPTFGQFLLPTGTKASIFLTLVGFHNPL